MPKTKKKKGGLSDTKLELSSFEEDMKELEKIVGQMNKGVVSLKESVDLFERGMKLSKKCSSQLGQANQVIKKVVSSYGDEDIKTEDFFLEEDDE